ncbi:hypothetical protein PanWU01x14_197360 [Parasponia andersonii]|uniref:Uncharacterized protein n=1 Tax=Parasponia andersonii TaxID=3476 RepID=A0A2P5BZF6_PARAD|nr:hypothetical protein PanWU01x14_197360 [Parasponia andersonii]
MKSHHPSYGDQGSENGDEDESDEEEDGLDEKICAQETEKRSGNRFNGGFEVEGLAMEGVEDRVGK